MKLLGIVFLALCAYAHSANLNVENNQIPIDGQLLDLLSNKHFAFHASGNAESGVKNSVTDSNVVPDNMVAERNVVVDTILQIMDELRNLIINGSEALPSLDPMRVPKIGPVELVAPAVRITASLENFNLEGLRWFVVDDVSFNALRLALGFHFTLPRLTISGDYNGEARLALFVRHTAGGAFRIFVNRVEVNFDMRIGTSLFGGNLFLRELDIVLDIHDTHVFFEGLIGDGWVNSIFNSIIQSISQEVIQSELDNVNQVINETLFELVDGFLRNFTLDDIQA